MHHHTSLSQIWSGGLGEQLRIEHRARRRKDHRTWQAELLHWCNNHKRMMFNSSQMSGHHFPIGSLFLKSIFQNTFLQEESGNSSKCWNLKMLSNLISVAFSSNRSFSGVDINWASISLWSKTYEVRIVSSHHCNPTPFITTQHALCFVICWFKTAFRFSYSKAERRR